MSVETPVQQQTPPPARPPGSEQPKRRRRGKLAMVGAILAAVAAVVVAVVLATGGGGGDSDKNGGTVKGSKENAFTIAYPGSWRPLAKDELNALPGKPLAVIRRKDGKGFVVIRREGGRSQSFKQLSAGLDKELQKRVPDFKKRSSKTVKIKGGNAFFTTYIRKKTGTVHSVVVVPAGDKTFTLNTVSRGGENKVAREIGNMILSFDAKK